MMPVDDWWRLHREPPPPPPPPPVIPFAGKTLFTAWAPTVAILERAHAAGCARVAVETTDANVALWNELRAGAPVDLELGVWDADNAGDAWPGAAFYITQVEAAGLNPPHVRAMPAGGVAIVTTLPELTMQRWASWTTVWLTECYVQDNPPSSPVNMEFQAHQSGLPLDVMTRPLVGVYHGKALADYAAELARFPHGFGVYLAEEMTDADWQTLGTL